ncbi:ABC transporter permease [Cellulomonas sp. URHD0024]|uniref:ABC transporter permease n=1 Tax=Cellulomonas sp. URHD0024 TaxID=1302620 RepID=UPI000426BC56|nr:ABC transporter permease [Cellulomonas sp. URHD0024]
MTVQTVARRGEVGALPVALVLARRNLTLFARDRTAVFFSMLSPLILLALYTFFLGSQQVDSLRAQFPAADLGDVHGFVDAWVFAGITMITSLTTGLAAMSVFVEDGESGRFQDFLVSPVRRSSLILGYMGATAVVAVTMTAAFVVISQVYTVARGGSVMTAAELVECLGVVVLSAGTFSALSAFAVTFVRTSSAFAALSTIVGTLIGFLAGAYIPIGALPAGAANVVDALPFAQSAMLVRGPFTAQPLAVLTDGQPAAAADMESFYGLTASVGGLEITTTIAVTVMVVVLVVFAALGAWRIGRRIG